MTIQLTPDQIKEKFAAANASASESFQGLPEGTYYMRLDKVELGKSKAGNKQVVHTFVVLSGDFKSKSHKMFSALSNEVQLSIMFKMWRMMGWDTTELTSEEMLKAYADDISKAGVHCMVRIWKQVADNGTEYTNTKIESIVDATPAAASTPVPAQTKPQATSTPAKPATPAAATAAAEPEAEPEPDVDTQDVPVTIDVGTKVKFAYKDKILEGEIKELVNDTTVKISSGGMRYTVNVEQIKDVIK